MHSNYRFTNSQIEVLHEELCKILKNVSFSVGCSSNSAGYSPHSVSNTVLYYSMILSWGMSFWLDKEN